MSQCPRQDCPQVFPLESIFFLSYFTAILNENHLIYNMTGPQALWWPNYTHTWFSHVAIIMLNPYVEQSDLRYLAAANFKRSPKIMNNIISVKQFLTFKKM